MSTLSEKKALRTKVDFKDLYPPFPREIIFDITSGCNQKCYFCSNQHIASGKYIDKELVKRLMIEAKAEGTTDMSLYGTGEPFLHKSLAEMTEFGKKKVGVDYIFISTNGALATPERAQPVLDAGIDSVKFSINGGTRESYKNVHGRDDFEKVIENLKWFAEYRKKSGLKYRIYVSMVQSSRAAGEGEVLRKIVEPYIDEYDLRDVSNQGGNMYENNETEEINKDNLLGSLKQDQFCGRCPDIFFRAVITPEGHATACVVDYHKFLILGDLNKHNLKEVWHNANYTFLRRKHIMDNLCGLICDNCLNNTNNKTAKFEEVFAEAKGEVKVS